MPELPFELKPVHLVYVALGFVVLVYLIRRILTSTSRLYAELELRGRSQEGRITSIRTIPTLSHEGAALEIAVEYGDLRGGTYYHRETIDQAQVAEAVAQGTLKVGSPAHVKVHPDNPKVAMLVAFDAAN